MKSFFQCIAVLYVIFIFSDSFAQNIPSHINFDTTFTNTAGSALVKIKNPTGTLLHITSVRTLTSEFYTSDSIFTVNPFDSVFVRVYFKTNQNITYNDFIIFENSELNYPIVNYLNATAKYPDTLYRFTQGLSDELLKTALRNFCSTNTNSNYTTSRTAMFSTIDDYNNDDTITCVYTGRKVYTTGIPSVNPPQSMNTEHTFPQGFFSQAEPMRSDVHHLYPTDETANNRRNNYDFGYVVSNVTWENGGSKLGNDFENQIVFEARDQHKGNIARCLFYFLIRYQNYGGFMDAKQENVLRQWNLSDTVDNLERIRENRIQAFQNNRSPFVDHPEFIDRIKSTYSVIPVITRPEISVSPYNVNFDTLAVNDTAVYNIAVFNYGTGSLNINSVSSSAAQFSVVSYPASVPANDYRFIKVRFRPDQFNQTFNSVLSIDNNSSPASVNMTGFSSNTSGITTFQQQIPFKYNLYQNYPNPFNPSTKIRFDIPSDSHGKSSAVKLVIFNSAGKELTKLVEGNLNAGSYEILFDASGYPSGIYYYRLSADNFTSAGRMILVK